MRYILVQAAAVDELRISGRVLRRGAALPMIGNRQGVVGGACWGRCSVPQVYVSFPDRKFLSQDRPPLLDVGVDWPSLKVTTCK
eukprot:1140694-Pyramimonas_sp.AAC.1